MLMGVTFADRPIAATAETVVIGTIDGRVVEISRTFEDSCTAWINEVPYHLELEEYMQLRRLALGKGD